ncbi:MAG: hypothetical protein ACERKZ_21330 [Lachnotalea sp.]
MGSLYELQYHILIKNQALEKEFMDEIRCRNSNLNITCEKVGKYNYLIVGKLIIRK